MTPGEEGQRRRRNRDRLIELGSSIQTMRETLRKLEEHEAELLTEFDTVMRTDDAIETEPFCAR
jgi:hypothetical protein